MLHRRLLATAASAFVFGFFGCHGSTVADAPVDGGAGSPSFDATGGADSRDEAETGDAFAPDAPVEAPVADVPRDIATDVPRSDAACPAGPVPKPGIDGCPADMVKIPAGTMSSPRGMIPVSAFCLDVTEVTAASYATACSSESCKPSAACISTYAKPGKETHPITCVTQPQSVAFCTLLGKRLPSDTEWEFAERGAPGSGPGTSFPWGSTLEKTDTCHLCWGPSSGGTTCAVGSFPAGNSRQGVMDLAGGVEEWTSTAEAPGHVRRGGSFETTDPDGCGADYGRGGESGGDAFRGFRCVKDLP